MAVPRTKDELLEAIDTNFSKLLRDLQTVPTELACEAGMDGHAKGTWISVSDLVSYLIGWNELVLKWLERDAAGKTVAFPESGFKWNELGDLAQKFYKDYEKLSYPERLARLSAAKARIVAAIEASNDPELYGCAWYGKWSKGRMIQLNTSSPYENARRRLRAWKKTLSI